MSNIAPSVTSFNKMAIQVVVYTYLTNSSQLHLEWKWLPWTTRRRERGGREGDCHTEAVSGESKQNIAKISNIRQPPARRIRLISLATWTCGFTSVMTATHIRQEASLVCVYLAVDLRRNREFHTLSPRALLYIASTDDRGENSSRLLPKVAAWK